MSSRQYYFLVSSLPMLHLGEELPITMEKFFESCRLHLTAGKIELLEKVKPVPGEMANTKIESQWHAWETYFRNALARERASKERASADQWLHYEVDVFPGILKQIGDAFSIKNPAEREMALDELRWQKLDDMAVEHPFDFEALVIYRIRLQIAERWARKDVATAHDKLNELLDKVEAQARKVRNA